MTTLNLQVAASADDAFENAASAMTLTGAAISLAAAGQWGGLRFLNVTVPNAATVNTATLQIYIASTSNDNVYLDAYGEDVDDAATFTTSAANISGRTLTTAKTPIGSSNVGAGWYSINVTSAVQEIINRAGWASGNDLAIILDALTSVDVQLRTWDHDTALAAKLDIDYTAAAGATTKSVYYARLRG